MQLKLRVFWFKDFLGLAIDQKSINHLSPLTPYYIWPRTEAWEQLKVELDLKTWISKEDKVSILNLTTEIINYWKENRGVESLEKAQARFCKINFVEFQN